MFSVNVGTSHLFRHLKNPHANRPTVETALEKIQAKRTSGSYASKRKIIDLLAEQQLSPYPSTHPLSVNVHRAILEISCLWRIPVNFKSIICSIPNLSVRKQIIFPSNSSKKVTSGRRTQWAKDYRASIKSISPQTCTRTDFTDIFFSCCIIHNEDICVDSLAVV